MNLHSTARRWAIRAGVAGFTAASLGLSLQYATAATATLAGARPAPVSASVIARMYSSADPYNPAYRHPYRHGVTPMLSRLAQMRAWALAHPLVAAGKIHALSASDVSFGGGIDGIGVTTGAEKVYLVFWGNQWGTETTVNGNDTFSNDPQSAAPYVQNLMRGLGTGSESWSGVMTQYCDNVPVGTQTCPSGNNFHVAYPTGGALAGVWYDNSAAEPSVASGHQIAAEAVTAAGHFGNTTAALNRDAQYVIISSTGLDPDSWLQDGYCAYHDYNGDSTLTGGAATSPYGDVSFTNMPYVTDITTSCGENFVNGGSAGTDDGWSIVEGHEYAETITDQNPAGGYTNSGGSEVGDLCAWDTGPGAPAADLSLTTGTFAMQSIWGNDGAGGGDCEFSHATEVDGGGGGGNTVTVNNPGNQTTGPRTRVSLQMTATDSQSGQTFTWTATGLPSGLSINSSGLISGTTGRHATTTTVTVTATDTTGAKGSTSFTWHVT